MRAAPGGDDPAARTDSLARAVDEMHRVLRPGAVLLSVNAAATDHIIAAFNARAEYWKPLRDGTLYITEDGYASINVDATMLAWERR